MDYWSNFFRLSLLHFCLLAIGCFGKDIIISTKLGSIRGTIENGFGVFKGIPYAGNRDESELLKNRCCFLILKFRKSCGRSAVESASIEKSVAAISSRRNRFQTRLSAEWTNPPWSVSCEHERGLPFRQRMDSNGCCFCSSHGRNWGRLIIAGDGFHSRRRLHSRLWQRPFLLGRLCCQHQVN